MPLSTKDTWNALVAEARKIAAFKDVRPLPINRIQNEGFLTTFPDLQLPACLITLKSGTDDADGCAKDRIREWSAVIIAADAGGDAWQQAVDLLDEFCDGEDKVLDKQILDGELTIYGGSDLNVPFCNQRRSVFDIAFHTREAIRR